MTTAQFNLNGWNKWGVPQYESVMRCEGIPKLYNRTGGELRSGYEETLGWYKQRATNTPQRVHVDKLLRQFRPTTTGSSSSSSPARPRTATPSGKNWSYWKKKKPHQEESSHLKVEGRRVESSRDPAIGQAERGALIRIDASRDYKSRDYKPQLRPKTAMTSSSPNKLMDPYTTSYDVNYGNPPTHNRSTPAERPATSRGYTASYKLGGKIGRTQFADEYGEKRMDERTTPIRSGTSSGARSNNPHPHQSFMVWRYGKDDKRTESCGAPAANRNYKQLSDSVLDEIIRDNFKSTYDNDYMGIPQGYQMKEAIGAPDDWLEGIPRPDDTSFRRTYKTPQQHPAHKLGTSRYDCNKLYVKPAVGIVPTVTSQHVVNQKNVKERTQYGDEYFDRSVNKTLNRLLNQRCDRDWDRFYLQATSINPDKVAVES